MDGTAAICHSRSRTKFIVPIAERNVSCCAGCRRPVAGRVLPGKSYPPLRWRDDRPCAPAGPRGQMLCTGRQRGQTGCLASSDRSEGCRLFTPRPFSRSGWGGRVAYASTCSGCHPAARAASQCHRCINTGRAMIKSTLRPRGPTAPCSKRARAPRSAFKRCAHGGRAPSHVSRTFCWRRDPSGRKARTRLQGIIRPRIHRPASAAAAFAPRQQLFRV